MDKKPQTMRCLSCDQYIRDDKEAIRNLKVITKPTPKPKRGEVLVQIKAAPCNPSDVIFLQNAYGVTKTLPAVPGWEGAGVVVASGGGILPWYLMGKRVACAGQADVDGTWAEYAVMKASHCIPLMEGVSFEQGATLIGNPFTAYGLVEKAQKEGHKAIVQTAAAGQLGRMVIRLCQDRKIPLINVVRREEQVDILKSEGAEIVLNSSDPNFRKTLKSLCKELNVTCGFDTVAGDMTGIILQALAPRSVLYVFGSLSVLPCSGISPLDLVFKEKRVEGFWLSKWIGSSSFSTLRKASHEIQSWMVDGSFATTIRGCYSFEEFPQQLLNYQANMTAGKAILKP